MNTNDGPWHCRTEGPWWKRLRMALFGLTAKEQGENAQTFAAMRIRIHQEEYDEDERILQEEFGEDYAPPGGR